MGDQLIIMKFIIRKLHRQKYYGGRHTDIHNLPKGLSNRLRHKRKDIDKVIKNLIKQDILLTKPTGYGFHVSLNSKKSKEIRKLID